MGETHKQMFHPLVHSLDDHNSQCPCEELETSSRTPMRMSGARVLWPSSAALTKTLAGDWIEVDQLSLTPAPIHDAGTMAADKPMSHSTNFILQ